MSHSVTLDEILSQLPDNERQAIEVRAAELVAEQATLKDLRQKAKLTQKRVSESLKMPQSNISRLEKNSDMLLSTLRGYVEAVGGKLNLTVELPDAPPVHLTGLGDLMDGQEQRPSS